MQIWHQEEQLFVFCQTSKSETKLEDAQLYLQLQAFLRDPHARHGQKLYWYHKRLPLPPFQNQEHVKKNHIDR